MQSVPDSIRALRRTDPRAYARAYYRLRHARALEIAKASRLRHADRVRARNAAYRARKKMRLAEVA